jgi:hypothetical protein
MKSLRRVTPASVLLIVLVATVVAVAWPRRDIGNTARGPSGSTSLAIQPFKVLDSRSIDWNSTAFADSLAARLGELEGLSTEVTGPRKTADFTLSGDVRLSEGRLVISTRLVHSSDRMTVWSGTFWRSENPTHSFVDDVAAGVAQALYADIARRALTTSRERS